MCLTDILLAEHQHIDRLIRLLSTSVNHQKQGQMLYPDFFINAARFIRVYADGIHHRKEEGILFPIIAPGMTKAVVALVGEHGIARGFTRDMAEAAHAWQNGDTTAALETVKNARNYAALMHDHILHENGVVFPATNWLITSSEQSRMDDMVGNLDMGSDDVNQTLSLLDTLEAQLV